MLRMVLPQAGCLLSQSMQTSVQKVEHAPVEGPQCIMKGGVGLFQERRTWCYIEKLAKTKQLRAAATGLLPLLELRPARNLMFSNGRDQLWWPPTFRYGLSGALWGDGAGDFTFAILLLCGLLLNPWLCSLGFVLKDLSIDGGSLCLRKKPEREKLCMRVIPGWVLRVVNHSMGGSWGKLGTLLLSLVGNSAKVLAMSVGRCKNKALDGIVVRAGPHECTTHVCCGSQRQNSTTLYEPQHSTTRLGSSCNSGGNCGLLGRTLNLQDAYKQFPTQAELHKAVVVALPRPHEQCSCTALDFGLLASQTGCNQVDPVTQ
eukprot:1814887-Amphidinium_carterae.1